MKKILKRVIIFICLFFLVGGIIDYFISKELRKVYIVSSEHQVWRDIYEHKIVDSCLIYGSSRAKVHIDPTMIEELTGITAYNFGQDGQSFDIQELRHRINTKENGYPQYILHSLDAFTLSKTEDLFNKPQFLPYLLWDFDMIPTLIQYNGFSYPDYFIPLARYYGNYFLLKDVLKEQLQPNNIALRKKGYSIESRNWNDDLDKAKVLDDQYRITINPGTRELYETFIQECKDKNIAYAMIYTPEHILGQEYIVNRDSIVRIYEEISKKYQVPFFNYTTDSICYDKQFFFNSMHLNRKGSIILTEKIARDLTETKFFLTIH